MGKVLEYDLLQLTPLGPWRREWGKSPFANYAVRREAKALLFAELSEALRQGCPLFEALALISQPPRKQAQRERMFVWDILSHFFSIITWIYGNIFYLILSSRFVNAPYVARVLAGRLAFQLRKGMLLSNAMQRCNPDYDAQEISLVQLGERTQRLPQTLRRMVELEGVGDRFRHMHARLAYPILVLSVTVFISSFILIKIMPKFTDIFLQLGARQLPPITQAVIDFSGMLIHSPLLLLLGIALPFLLFRVLMNGNPMTRRVLSYGIVFTLVWAMAGIVMEVVSKGRQTGYGIILVCSIAALGLLSLPFIFKGIELIILRIETRLHTLLRWIPRPGNPLRTEAESRWVASLATALQAGLPAPDAVRLAGKTIGYRYQWRSVRAAQAIESGMPIGAACARSEIFGSQLTNRLLFLDDNNDDYINRLSFLSAELSEQANEQMTRYGWFAEVTGILIVGAIVMCLVVAIYMPLFSIPSLMEFTLP